VPSSLGSDRRFERAVPEWQTCGAGFRGGPSLDMQPLLRRSWHPTPILFHRLFSGEVPRGEKMLYSGTDPETYITEYTLVYKDFAILGVGFVLW